MQNVHYALDLGENGCFFFLPESYTPTYQSAQDYCNAIGNEYGREIGLAEIYNQETQDLVSQHASQINSDFDWWLGAVSSDKGQVSESKVHPQQKRYTHLPLYVMK